MDKTKKPFSRGMILTWHNCSKVQNGLSKLLELETSLLYEVREATVGLKVVYSGPEPLRRSVSSAGERAELRVAES